MFAPTAEVPSGAEERGLREDRTEHPLFPSLASLDHPAAPTSGRDIGSERDCEELSALGKGDDSGSLDLAGWGRGGAGHDEWGFVLTT